MNKMKDHLTMASSILSLCGVIVLATFHISNLGMTNAIQDQKQEFTMASLNEVKSELKEQRAEIKSIYAIVTKLESRL